MNKKLTNLTFLLLFTVFGFAQNKNIKIDKNNLLKHVETLSSDQYEGRRTGEKGNDSARAYIIKQFEKLNITGYNDNFEQPFSFTARKKEYKAVNVLAEIKGTETPEKYIVISAHYDHLGVHNGKIYNGADDDASGVAALFAFAEYFIKNPPKHSVILAAFDAEELGLRGAKHFVETFDKSKILVNLNMDMISRSNKDELYVVGARYTEWLSSILNSFKNPTSSKLSQGHDGTDGKQDWTMASDHGPFHSAKIPFLYFGNEDHAAYHKPTDDFKDITPEFYVNAVEIILSVFTAIDDSEL
ncbi:M28 family peptidase [Winogradskyella echinorum]|uniref:M28 family peptidase n=1 Tax=Winogradskyella echinorum TaxID=538189 RepID=A0ABR6XZL5_9FLAO|nr:M20/M25/M40 family metallo-hydrolase [Winogradskyella echinorum]MBC3845910.1 M28 family peptidase [Winogradskyella echinorum]MBC5750258.1 M28 family peptidase [Winogradskyella echinorum]